MIRRHIIFYGQVQGVGFRYYASHKAEALGLTGWVRNLPDGTVEMEIQGREEGIDDLILFLDRRQWIEITAMDVKKLPVTEERQFTQRL